MAADAVTGSEKINEANQALGFLTQTRNDIIAP